MTTHEKLKSMLIENGLFENQAESVMELARPEIDKLFPDYRITWDRPANEYPKQMFNIWFVTMRPIAFNWIEKNCPQAWFKSIFA